MEDHIVTDERFRTRTLTRVKRKKSSTTTILIQKIQLLLAPQGATTKKLVLIAPHPVPRLARRLDSNTGVLPIECPPITITILIGRRRTPLPVWIQITITTAGVLPTHRRPEGTSIMPVAVAVIPKATLAAMLPLMVEVGR